jgi:hypothetical protein
VNVSCNDAFNARDEATSVPNGFSMMMRERSTNLASSNVFTTMRAADGGTAR